MAVLTLAVIGICQIAFIRENALDLLIILFILTSLPQIFFRLLLLRLQKSPVWDPRNRPGSRYINFLATFCT